MNRFLKHINDYGSVIHDTETDRWIPEDEGNADYADLIASGAEIVDYAPPEPTLDEAKAAKLVEISAAYAHYDETASTVVSLGYPIQLGQAHISKLDGAVRFAEMAGAAGIYITDANNVTHEGVPLADAKTALMEVMGAALQAHHYKQTLRALVEAAETVEAVLAVGWEM